MFNSIKNQPMAIVIGLIALAIPLVFPDIALLTAPIAVSIIIKTAAFFGLLGYGAGVNAIPVGMLILVAIINGIIYFSLSFLFGHIGIKNAILKNIVVIALLIIISVLFVILAIFTMIPPG